MCRLADPLRGASYFDSIECEGGIKGLKHGFIDTGTGIQLVSVFKLTFG